MSVRIQSSLLPVAAVLVLVGSAPTFAGVLVVDAAGGASYLQIGAAVAAAQEGDTVLVRAGTYDGFSIVAKSVSVVADAYAPVLVRGSSSVRDLAATQTVLLSGLDFGYLANQGPSAPWTAGEALTVVGVAGDVRLQDCVLNGKGYPTSGFAPGGAGLRALDNPGDVALSNCQLVGGRGASYLDFAYAHYDGGAGLEFRDTRVALHDCTLTGGRGGNGFDSAGDGGAGAWARASTSTTGLFASHCAFLGGRGGDDYEDIFQEFSAPGDGGHGLHVQSGTAAQVLDCTFVGGAVGIGVYCPPTVYFPSPGQPTAGAGTVFTFGGHHLRLEAPRVLRAGTLASITVRGDPGDLVSLWLSRSTGFRVVPSWRGVVIPALPTPARAQIVGTIPGSGQLTVLFPAPTLAPGTAARDDYVQVFRRDANGATTLGSSVAVTTIATGY